MFSLVYTTFYAVGVWTRNSEADPEIALDQNHILEVVLDPKISGVFIGFLSATFLKLHRINNSNKEGNVTNNILPHFNKVNSQTY